MHPRCEAFDEEAIDQAVEYLREASRVAVLTGAGVSAESGVATFRGAGGLWEGYRVEDVATPMAFARDPELVWRFYNARRENLRSVRPNPGHFALAALESRYGDGHFTLITQNVDGLHKAAGTRRLLELHGNIRRVRCTQCKVIEDRGDGSLDPLPSCTACGALVRPDIVWFHEMLPEDTWTQSAAAVNDCRCLLVVGTSAVVYPAASLIPLARAVGARVIEVNLEPSDARHLCDVGLYGPSGEMLPKLVERLQ